LPPLEPVLGGAHYHVSQRRAPAQPKQTMPTAPAENGYLIMLVGQMSVLAKAPGEKAVGKPAAVHGTKRPVL